MHSTSIAPVILVSSLPSASARRSGTYAYVFYFWAQRPGDRTRT
jgi:hypothetical protein